MKTKKKMSVAEKFGIKTISKEGKIAALYVRVSSDEFVKNEQGEKERRQSVKSQILDLTNEAKKRGYEYMIYDADCDISGKEDVADRPALTAISNGINENKIHTVIFRELKRVFRNFYEQQKWIAEVVKPKGVELYSLTEGKINYESFDGNLSLAVKGLSNQQELVYTSQRSTEEKNRKALAGTLRTTPAYGYGVKEIDGIRKCYIKEEEASLIREIFNRYVAGEGMRKIQHDFAKRGIKTKHGKLPNTANMVRWIHNPIYKGVLIWNNKEVASPYPKIIDVALWEKANTISKSRLSTASRKERNGTHLATGFLKCGYCYDRIKKGETHSEGHKLYESFVIGINNKIIGNKRYNFSAYRCQSKAKGNSSVCPDSISFNELKLEKFFADWLGVMISKDFGTNEENTDSLVKQLRKEISNNTEQASVIKERLKKLDDRYYSGENDMTDIVYEARQTTGKNTLIKVERELAEKHKKLEAITEGTIKQALKPLKDWYGLTIEQKREGLRKLFDCFLIYKDMLVIVYRDGSSVDLPIIRGRNNEYIIDLDLRNSPLTKPSNYKFSNIELPPM